MAAVETAVTRKAAATGSHEACNVSADCFRFDDTNPAKENCEFEESILEDTKLLGVEWEKVTHTSDYLQQLQDACTEMIKKGEVVGVHSHSCHLSSIADMCT